MERNCLRLVYALAAAIVWTLVGACEVYAHGGAVAPPPPPESGPGGAPKGPTGTPDFVNPGIGGPIVTPAKGPSTDRPGSRRRRKGDVTPTWDTSWELWWEVNRYALLPRPQPDPRARVVTPESSAPAGDWAQRRAMLARERVEPFLLEVVAPDTKYGDDVVGSALIALGKLAADGTAADPMLDWMLDETADDMLRESAALGLGLLRRTRQGGQVEYRRGDPLRARLLQIWDRRMGKDRVKVPRRARVFVMYALGLLGDQPFDPRPLTKDGRLFSKLMWDRLAVRYKTRDLRAAPIVALGLQPAEGLPDAVKQGLRDIVGRETVQGRKWDAYERAHALTAIARLGGPEARSRILRVLSDVREHDAVRISALLAVGERPGAWSAIERQAVARAIERGAQGDEPKLLLQGLSRIALGRLVEADIEDGGTRLVSSGILKALEGAATTGPWYTRGYAMLALAFATRRTAKTGIEHTGLLLVDQLRQTRLHPSARGAAAVALGLLGDPRHVGALATVLKNKNEDAEVRGHAALAIGQIQVADADTRAALEATLGARHGDKLRGRAALALGLLGQTGSAGRLVAELGDGRSVVHLSNLTVALGHLGDLDAVEGLLGIARSSKREVVQAMAVVALGRLLDPEPKPSLLRLLLPANYPARGDALAEALTIL